MPKSTTKAPDVRKSIITMWRTLTRRLKDPYRPELHYMRGPGPKWREKHGQQTQDDASVSPVTTSPMTEAAA
jgi:hypothetical protein